MEVRARRHARLAPRLCDGTLARAQPQSGHSAVVAGYVGKAFDDAIAPFARMTPALRRRETRGLMAALWRHVEWGAKQKEGPNWFGPSLGEEECEWHFKPVARRGQICRAAGP